MRANIHHIVLLLTLGLQHFVYAQQAPRAPAARDHHAMVYDAKRAVIVLFGGCRLGAGKEAGVLDDMWEWDGHSWSQIMGEGPSARCRATMVFDRVNATLLLFGGEGRQKNLNDLWQWDGVHWRLVAQTGPSPRPTHAMVYDESRKVTVLYGGWTPARILGDTWEWDGHGWKPANTGGRDPGPRDMIAMTYDPNCRGVILFGGRLNRTQSYSDVWKWNGVEWGQIH